MNDVIMAVYFLFRSHMMIVALYGSPSCQLGFPSCLLVVLRIISTCDFSQTVVCISVDLVIGRSGWRLGSFFSLQTFPV